jgi:GABA(A) receptor-associated protein
MKKSHEMMTFEERLADSTKIVTKHPNRVCVYIKKSDTALTIPNIDKNKFLVPDDITVAQFVYIIRKRIRISSTQALFFYVNNSLVSGNTTMNELNRKYKNDDGFVYIKYTGENCFG